MSNDQNDRGEERERSTAWLVGGLIAPGLAFVVAAIVWSWRAPVLGGMLQVLGVVYALVGVAVVRVWLEELAADKASAAKHGLDRLLAVGQAQLQHARTQLQRAWAHLRGRPAVHLRSVGVTAKSEITARLTVVERPRVNRDTISDREWLAFLDDRVESLITRMDQADQSRDQQRNELRAEIKRETRQGWQLILAGLIWSAVGTVVGIVR